MHRHPPISPLFPYTTLFRSVQVIVQLLRDKIAHELADRRAIGPHDLRTKLGFCLRLEHRFHHLDADCRQQKPSLVRKSRSEEHTSELQSLTNLVCRLLLEKK